MTERITATAFYRPNDSALRFLPEGPYPLADSQFSWVAIQHGGDSTQGSINVFDLENGNNRSHILPGRPGFAFPCDDNHSFVVGCERALGIFHPSEISWSPFCEDIDNDVDGTIINDGLVWKDNLIFGCKDLEFKTKKAGLYLWRGSDRSLHQLRNDQVCSNGKAIIESADGLSLIDIDSPTRQIVRYALDIENAKLGEPKVVVDLTADGGVPDGAIVTPDGNGVIVSIYNPEPAPAGETRLYDLASGELKTIWETPGSPQNTCPNLVRHGDKVHLVITTAVEHMSEERQADAPQAGSLFYVPTDFTETGSNPKFPLGALS